MVRDLASTLRLHIVAIAVCATVAFGYLFKNSYPVGLALLCGFDWCIVNLLNRATDVDEDLRNGITATELVARHARVIVLGSLTALAVSLAWGFVALPVSLAITRVVFHALGLGYSFRVVPTLRGLKRFKDIYVFKNTMSAVMFVLSVGLYPLLGITSPLAMRPLAIVSVMVFFFLFEHSFEILYDLRDTDGDRAVGVPTYPVVNGPGVSTVIIHALCATSAVVLFASRALGVITTREVLLAVAPVTQSVLLARLGHAKISRGYCIAITYGGAAMLVVFLIGTALWRKAGMPFDL